MITNLLNAEFDYLGPFLNGVAEYRIGGIIGFINKKYEIINKNVK